MDQQRDTNGQATGSRRDVFDNDSLPTLFELPDRTPNRLKLRGRSVQISIHDAHNGPPASHVDPPSGDHSYLKPHHPTPPTGPSARRPEESDESCEGSSGRPEERSAAEEALASEEKVAANRGPGRPRWVETPSATWVSRSAIGLLVFAMVTVAFLSGRGWRDRGQSSDGRNADDAIVISEDVAGGSTAMASAVDDRIEIPDASGAPPQTSSGESATASGEAVTGLLARGAESLSNQAPQTGRQVAADDRAAVPPTLADSLADAAKPPSDVARADAAEMNSRGNSARGMLGAVEPSPETAAGDTTSQPTLEMPMTPSLGESGGVVSYRDASSESGEAGEGLPAGMIDRLRPDNGLRYTDTPHPIGNFLEILEAWEASERQ